MPKLAVIILTCNEQQNIAACLETVQFADEILVVDSGSSDDTIAIAEKCGARVINHPMESFAGQRNFAAEQTDADWIFYLDADERLTNEAEVEIKEIVSKGEPAAYNIKRINFIFGQRMMYGAHSPDMSCRLFFKGTFKWHGMVHEIVEVTVPIKNMHCSMHHYTYNSWKPYFAKFDKYTTLMAQKMHEQGKKASFVDIIFRPPFAFFRAYILKLGFLDGKLGFIFSVFHGYYTFAKYIKLKYFERL